MPQGPFPVVICYDIADDRRRRRLAALLEGYGGRRQWSVFEVVLDHAVLDKVKKDITALLDPERDRVVIYSLCRNCAARRLDIGLPALDRLFRSDPVIIV